MTDPQKSQPPMVLFVNHSLEMGGIETMIRDFAMNLDPKRYRVVVAVFRSGGALADELSRAGREVVSLDKREGLDPWLPLRLRRQIQQCGASVVHSHNYSAWLYCVLASFGMRGVRLVHTEHSRVLPLARRRWLERRLSQFTRAVVAVSADVARSLVHDIGVARSRVGLIANGINLSRFRPVDVLRREARAKCGIPDDSIAFGILARLVPVKSHATLVSAFAMLRQRAPNVHLVIAGDGPCRSALEAQVLELQLQRHVHFLGEVHDGERVLNSLDVYMLSSVDEGMNLTLLEAMGTSLPVIATNVGGNAEVVADGVTGIIVPALQPAAMAAAMERLVREPLTRCEMGARGRARVEAEFSQARTLDAYMALYDGAPVQPWQG